jgi:hypothetical protein
MWGELPRVGPTALSPRSRIGQWLSSSLPTSMSRSVSPEHKEQDYDAWTSSMEYIAATPRYPEGAWPREMTRDQNRADLHRMPTTSATGKGSRTRCSIRPTVT